MVDGSDLAQVLAEASDIARSVSQKLTTSHAVLALFTVENEARALLEERGVNEDRLLACMTAAPTEPDGTLREVKRRAQEIASGCGASETDCLHLLIATTRIRCAAQNLLGAAGLDLGALRNTALSYHLNGGLPRRLRSRPRELARAPAVSPRPSAHPAANPGLKPILTPRDLVDTEDLQPAEPPKVSPLAPRPDPERQPAKPSGPASPSVRAHALEARGGPALRGAPGQDDPFALDAGAFPLLSALGRNLTLSASRGELDPVVGRDREIDEVIDILGKRRTNNPCLVGEPGVGKTAVVEGVAQRLIESSGGPRRIVVSLDVGSLVAGTQLRGAFSERLGELQDEVRAAGGKVVVFIDELHTLVGAGASGEGPQDAANELKAAMARGEFPCIGATTHDEFRKHIAQDPALERRFTSVRVNEPSVPETVAILRGVVDRYEAHHGLTYAPEALETAASLGAKYVSDRFLPDKAFAIIDLAGSRAKRAGKTRVASREVAQVVAQLAGVPEERLLLGDGTRLLELERELGEKVVGHPEVVSKVASVIRRNYAGFASRRPMGSFLFLGPTGVGKTELARSLAQTLFGTRDALVHLDMSEMSEAHAVSRLIGSPAGYVGFGEGGQLTEPVRRKPSCVVVLDEIEKAHRDVWMLLLQVLDEGRLADAKGRHIDFSNTVVVLTTNLGAEAFSAERPKVVGFGAAASELPDASERACEQARAAFPPELWNRIDERCVFQPLGKEAVANVAQLLLDESSRRLQLEKGIHYVADETVVAHLLESGGFDPKLGARPMRRAVQRLIEAPLAERILRGELKSGDHVRLTLREGELRFARAAS